MLIINCRGSFSFCVPSDEKGSYWGGWNEAARMHNRHRTSLLIRKNVNSAAITKKRSSTRHPTRLDRREHAMPQHWITPSAYEDSRNIGCYRFKLGFIFLLYFDLLCSILYCLIMSAAVLKSYLNLTASMFLLYLCSAFSSCLGSSCRILFFIFCSFLLEIL